jgi:hypothetical protein
MGKPLGKAHLRRATMTGADDRTNQESDCGESDNRHRSSYP